MIDGAGRRCFYDVIHGLGPAVECRDRRCDDGAHFRRGKHQSQVPQMQRGFPGQEDQPAPLLEVYVGRPHQQIVGEARHDGAQCAHRARGHDHSAGAK